MHPHIEIVAFEGRVVNVREYKLLYKLCMAPYFDQSGDYLGRSANCLLAVCSKRDDASDPRKLKYPSF